MRKAQPHPFLAADADADPARADAVIAGFATGDGASFRGGAAGGPSGIRMFSDSVESYSPSTGRDLSALALADAGDVDDPRRLVGTVWTDRRPFLLSLGGDHAITPPIVRAVAGRASPLAVVGFDAHLDLRKEYPGEHACTFRRIADDGVPCAVVGVRSGARQEWEDAGSVLVHHGRSLDLPARVRRTLERSKVYVTIDVDVLDPAVAPGVGNPEPGGATYPELLAALDALAGLDVVAADLVEVSPALDPSGVTQVTAAILVRELLVRFAVR